MAGLFDEVLASGGWTVTGSPEYNMSWGETENGPRNGFDQYLNSLPPRHILDKLGFPPEPQVTENGSERAAYEADIRNWMAEKGYRVGNQNGAAMNSLIGPDGRPVAGTQWSVDDTGDFVRDAAIVALGGYFGGSALAGAYGGAGAAAGAGAAEGGLIGGDLMAGYGAGTAGAGGSAASLVAPGAAGSGASLVAPGAAGAVGSTAGFGAGGAAAVEAAGSVATAAPSTSGSWLESLGSGVSNMGAKDWVNIISGIYGMKLSGDARKASDPFGQYRAGYGQQLAALEANPNLITGRPGWRAGIDLIDRQMGARGYLGSGNNRAALSRYAGDFYDKEMSRLAGLAGAGAAPGAGRFQSADLAGQSLASIGYGLAPYFKGGGGGSGGTSGSAVGGDLMYGWGQGIGNYFGGP